MQHATRNVTADTFSMQHATRNVAVTPCGLLDKCWLVHRRRLACEHLVVLGDVPARAEHAASNTHQCQSAHENAHGCTSRSDCRHQHTHTTLFTLRNVAMSDRSSCSDDTTLSVHVWAPQCRQCATVWQQYTVCCEHSRVLFGQVQLGALHVIARVPVSTATRPSRWYTTVCA